MSYHINFSKPNKEEFPEPELNELRQAIEKSFPKAEVNAREINFDFAQMSIFDKEISLAIPYWSENRFKEQEINELLKILFLQGYHGEDSQTEKHLTTFDPTIFEDFKSITQSLLVTQAKEKFPCGDIRCSIIGMEKLAEIASNNREILSIEEEQALVAKKAYKELFLNQLKFAFSVAKRYHFKWVEQAAIIDASIDGLEIGLPKFIKGQYDDFKVVEYIVWWCQRSCIECMLRRLWAITSQSGYKFYSKEAGIRLIEQWKNGDQTVVEEVLYNHTFLFQKLEEIYGLQLDEVDKRKASIKALSQESSMRDLETEAHEMYKAELEIEDFIFLEYTLILEEARKDSRNKKLSNTK